MSLNVYLHMAWAYPSQVSGPRIFLREDGQTKSITREEWDRRFPGREPVTAEVEDSDCVFSWNITHNLGSMAYEAGIYTALWRPEELGITQAQQLIGRLETGLCVLQQDPDRFKAFNPANGWGDYEGLIACVEAYLAACRAYPVATVSVSR